MLGASAPTYRSARLALRVVEALTALSGPLLALVATRTVPRESREQEGTPTGRPAPCRPPLTVLIPARDEAPVIAQLVADLGRAAAACDLADGSVRVIVIDDRSRDGTAEVARAALAAAGFGTAGSVICRSGGKDGKGAALGAVQPEHDPQRVLVVLDADARVGPGFLDRCRSVFGPAYGTTMGAPTDGGATVAATARRRMLRPLGVGRVARTLARVQDAEQGIDDVVLRGRLALGGAAEFRGDGMALTSGLLSALGGWPVGALCEDLDLSARLAASGLGQVRRPVGLEVWEQPVLGLRALVVQRLRWAEGAIRRDLGTVLPAVGDHAVPPRRRTEIGVWAAQTLVPWTVVGLAARLAGARGPMARRLLVELGLAYACSSATLAWVALGSVPELSLRHRVATTGPTVVFGGLWLGILPVAWVKVAVRHGPPRFDRTAHLRSDQFSEPGPGPR